MIKELAYGGHSANPSDYASVDGDLALSMNVINEDGALRPILRPTEEITFPQGSKVMHIHEMPTYRNFIFVHSEDFGTEGDDEPSYHKLLCFRGTDGNEGKIHDFVDATITDVKSLGNTLVICAEGGVHYALWKGEDYKYLGMSIPELPLSFGLQGEEVQTDTISNSQYTNIGKPTVLAKVNKLITDEVTKKGKFCFPFFVRYAYRLYDETLTKHSAPILMYASRPELSAIYLTGTRVKVYNYYTDDSGNVVYDEQGNPSVESWYMREELTYATMACDLDFCVKSKATLQSLKDWGDIVKSVDIFVSSPILNYDQDGAYFKADEIPYGEQYFVGRLTSTEDSSDGDTYYCKRHLAGTNDGSYSLMKLDKNDQIKSRTFELSRNKDLILEDLNRCSTYYLLKSYDLDKLPLERSLVKILPNYLSALETKEVMTDDYGSHDTLAANTTTAYNNRFNLIGVRRTVFDGYDASSLFPYTNAGKSCLAYVYVNIREDNKDILVKCDAGIFGESALYTYFFYPNINAHEAYLVIRENASERNFYKVPLEKHDFLNGAYFFGDWRSEQYKVENPDLTVSSDTERTISLPNRIYTSLVNNPFSFPAELITSVGTSRVIALAIAKQTISPNEFGQFPMYAFTEEGVWALGVNSEGAFTPAQPITSDVLINDDGILSLDNSVIYSTARGLMLLSGSESLCISDGINASNLFSLADLPRGEGVMKVFDKEAFYLDHFYPVYGGKLSDTKLLPFLEFIKDSQMIYDYVHQHILIFNPKVSYAYVYSLKSKMWGMRASVDFMYTVQSTTNHAYAMYYIDAAEPDDGDDTQMLLDYSKSDDGDVRSLVITRPIKLEDPFDFQTIQTIIQRGEFKGLQQVLYGTNDYEHWFVVWSSKDKYMRGFSGSPYKAYRIVFMATMRPSDNIYGATIEYKPKLTNKPR